MKKILSMILACAMIMSLFCVVPASAAVKSTSPKYFFEDFETGTADKNSLYYGTTATNTLPTFVAGGADGSAYAAKISYGTATNKLLNFTGSDSNAANLTHWTIEPGETLTFSFKFKWTELNGLTANKDMGLKFMCAAGTGDGINEGITTNSWLGANNTLITTGTWKYTLVSQTDTWQTPTWTWTNNTGKAVTLNGKSYNGNIMSNFYSNKQNVEFLIDDIELKITDSVTTNDPVVSSGAFTVSNEGVVNADYTFTSPSAAADETVLKLKYNDAVIGSFKKGDSIVVPESVRTADGYNKSNVGLEAIPIDAAGKIGVATKLAYIEMSAPVAGTDAVTIPTLKVVRGSSDFNAVLLVAFYDTNEAGDKYLLKIEQKHIEVTTDAPTLNLTNWSASTTVSDADYIIDGVPVAPESAEVFLLECTASTAEQKANPIFYTTLKEYAYVGDITIG